MKTPFPTEQLKENLPLTTRQAAKLITRIRRTTGGIATSFSLLLLGCFSRALLLIAAALCYGIYSSVRLCLYKKLSVHTVFAFPESALFLKGAKSRWCSFYRLKTVLSLGLLCLGGIFAIFYLLPYFERYRSLFALCAIFFACVGLRAVMAVFFRKKILSGIEITAVEDTENADDFSLRQERKKALLRFGLSWLLLGLLYLFVSLYVGSFTLYLNVPVIGLLLSLLRILLNNPFARFSSFRSRTLAAKIRNVLSLGLVSIACVAAVLAGSWYNTTYIFTLPYPEYTATNTVSYDASSGVFTITPGEDREFRILQLTDIHIGAGITTVIEDRKAIDACLTLIYENDPDLIIVTGDIAYPAPLQSFSLNNQSALAQFCEMMDRVSIPWALVLGNHDTEPLASHGAEDLDKLFSHYAYQNGGCLLYADKKPEIFGRYNQYIRLNNKDGTLNRLLFLIDSNDYASEKLNDYDTIHTDQIAWYEKTVDACSTAEKTVPSFVFFHIPIPEFHDAYQSFLSGSPDAEYLFGKNLEGVSHPKENTGFFDSMLSKKSTQAVFVGHDHVNYAGIRYMGIDLIYSKSIDFLAYPGISGEWVQRGGTLISVGKNGEYTVTQPSYTRLHHRKGILSVLLSE